MLLRFGVSNHLSICESQELSFAASSLKDQREGLIDCDSVPSGAVLPAVVIYGANASGKTNLIDAMERMQRMVLRSHAKGEPGGGVSRDVFKLDSACLQKPSQFDMDFVIDGVRHHYGFEATDEAYVAEWLYTFPKSHRRRMFVRDQNGFYFGRWLKGQNNNIAGLTRSNSLFLSAAAQNGHEQLSKVYDFFRSIKFSNFISMSGVTASKQFTADDPDFRIIDFLESINTGVTGYQKKEIEIPEEIQTTRRELSATFEKLSGGNVKIELDESDKFPIIEFAHRGRGGEAVYFDLDVESAGTRRLLIILGLTYQALDQGTLLCVDELDASLHTHACAAILKLFCTPEINQNGAQLVATTHDTNLMKSMVLRRDQLWFTEKTWEGATELYPLTDIRTRKGDNIELGYLQGRYGALPGDDPISALYESP